MKLIDKYKPYFWPVILIIISIATIIYVVMPTVSQIITTREEMATLEVTRLELAKKATILESNNEQLTKSDLARAETALPTDKNVSGMIFGLESLASSASAKLLTFSAVVGNMATESAKIIAVEKDNKLGNKVEIISVETTVNADFSALQIFLTQLNNVNRLIGINNLTWEKSEANVIFDVFYQPLATTLGKITTPIYELTQEDRVLIKQVSAYPLATPATISLPAGKPNPFN
ncbi:MAG: hypothetical protein Q7S14_02855 [bacterium]|nr:hypothetical protein [bacterium]